MDSTDLDVDVELVIGNEKREWKNKSGIITTLQYDEKEFNIKDCILSWYLLSFEKILLNQSCHDQLTPGPGTIESVKLFVSKFTQKSTMHFDIVDELLSTPIGGDKGIPMSRYDCEADWENTSYAHTYYDIFKYFDTCYKIRFVDNPVPWNPIEIWKCHKPNNLVDGIPIYEDKFVGDIGLRWHSINTMFFNYDEPTQEPTFTKCLTYGLGR